MSVRPSTYLGQLVSHWSDFYEILCLSIFQKYIEKIQISFKSDKKSGNVEENNQQNALINSSINLLMSDHSNMFRLGVIRH
jgi:hypothetical protein